MKICVITDNEYIFSGFMDLLERKPQEDCEFEFFYTSWNKGFKAKYADSEDFKPVLLKAMDESFYSQYDLFISLHCKQLFPAMLVENHPCINVHPGLNPYNRGWFPQVFSILNKLPIGVTIHKMDVELDHGDILYQKELFIKDSDTSKDIYNRILATEMELLDLHLEEILKGTYKAIPMAGEGNMNTKADFDALCELNLDEKATYGEVIDRLRALTFAPYENAYFYDKNGKKVFVGITLRSEEDA